MLNRILISLIVLIVIWLIFSSRSEPFAEISGQFCGSCQGKGVNQCTNCFNCLYMVDQWGNSQCLGGDIASGPYNKEKYALAYAADPYLRMKYNNKHYLSSYGFTPKAANRRIGIYPCGYVK